MLHFREELKQQSVYIILFFYCHIALCESQARLDTSHTAQPAV